MKYFINKIVLFVLFTAILATSIAQTPENWHHLPPSSKTFGINTLEAYKKALSGKVSNEVVVAIIDGGTDINHKDLKENIWRNSDEIPFNGIDDDKNGYIDDSVGWNFIGSADGNNVEYDNYEFVRIIRAYRHKFEDMYEEDIDSSEKELFNIYLNAKKELENRLSSTKNSIDYIEKQLNLITRIENKIDKSPFSHEDIKDLEGFNNSNSEAISFFLLKFMLDEDDGNSDDLKNDLNKSLKHYEAAKNYHLNVDYDPRNMVGDDYLNVNDRFYGNADVKGPDAEHGTHVAGIVGAIRENNFGMNGVAANVKLMILRAVPNGDERDKDVANAIRYAVDNGAKVINMSFGKGYSWNKAIVDSAVKYAESKDVLLVHAAGNDSKDNDTEDNFPNDQFLNGGTPNNWIEVGASHFQSKYLAASFSNFGKENVDVFAPGVDIYSTTPNDSFQRMPGTSMASPVCAGLAALIRSYYPQLSAAEVKDIIIVSSKKYRKKVPFPGKDVKISFKELSVSGGVINAYNALLLAEKRTSNK